MLSDFDTAMEQQMVKRDRNVGNLTTRALDQRADVLGHFVGRTAGVDDHEFDRSAEDAGAGVELLDGELSAGQARGPVDAGRPLQGHQDRKSVV